MFSRKTLSGGVICKSLTEKEKKCKTSFFMSQEPGPWRVGQLILMRCHVCSFERLCGIDHHSKGFFFFLISCLSSRVTAQMDQAGRRGELAECKIQT